ncbi:predicted protein [Chaetoceros tenuissimus]|uniref:Uncharacterized protein n=1 Tax=Chaetoceros tenuissimus TaxID=426638 RepID=A0AAD3CL43_9STRA|nr:predicted protein [Chaetoceros tenuissimus]
MNTTATGSAITSGISFINPDFAIKGMGMLLLILGTRGVLAPHEVVKDLTSKKLRPSDHTNQLKCFTVFGIVGAIPCVVTPEFGCKLWGVVGMDKLTPAFGHGLGYSLITINAFNAALAWGVDPQVAFGYIIALFWGVLGNMKTLITPEFKEVEINKKTVMFWSTMWSITAAVVLA